MGHTVLLIPVPAFEPFVRARWEHYDPTWTSRDPAFVHAHITVLSPFVTEPTAADLATAAGLAAGARPTEVRFEQVAAFPDGILHVVPDPVAPFAALTAAAESAFPQCPPYEGRFDELVPHLTLDHEMTGQSVDSVTAALADSSIGPLPLTARVEHLDLQWYAEGECRLMARWRLGSGLRLR